VILAKKRVRGSWSAEEKRSICLQTLAPGVSVAQVARRYAMNANPIFKWLKDPRFQPDELEIEETAFFSVEISTEPEATLPTVHQPIPSRKITKSSVEPCEMNEVCGPELRESFPGCWRRFAAHFDPCDWGNCYDIRQAWSDISQMCQERFGTLECLLKQTVLAIFADPPLVSQSSGLVLLYAGDEPAGHGFEVINFSIIDRPLNYVRYF
jgi:transposase